MLDGCGPVFEGEERQKEYVCEKVGRNHKEVPKPRMFYPVNWDSPDSICNDCLKSDVCKYKEEMNKKRLDLGKIGFTKDGPFTACIICKYFQKKEPMIVPRS